MRKNEFKSLEDFTSQYTGEWNPSGGHWFGLDFKYNGNEYRLNTGNMYKEEPDIASDNRPVMFCLYKKNDEDFDEYELLNQFSSMQALLDSNVIANIPFRDIIMADETELLGQD